ITDGLTGLFNQRHFSALLHQEVERAVRMQSPLSLLMIDIDHFKQLNDSLGHEYGNDMIKLAGKLIRESVREIDTVGRYGGDEFAVILPGASAQEAQRLAQRIAAAV